MLRTVQMIMYSICWEQFRCTYCSFVFALVWVNRVCHQMLHWYDLRYILTFSRRANASVWLKCCSHCNARVTEETVLQYFPVIRKLSLQNYWKMSLNNKILTSLYLSLRCITLAWSQKQLSLPKKNVFINY